MIIFNTLLALIFLIKTTTSNFQPVIPSYRKQSIAPQTNPTLPLGVTVPRARSYQVTGNKNSDLTVRLLSDISIPDGTGELNWPIFVPSVYSDSHELRNEASVSNAESSARVGISVRSGSEEGPQIFNLGFNDENKLKIHVLSSSNVNVANLKWTLSYNEGTEVASDYVAYVDGEAEIVFDDEIGGGGLINIASTSATYLVSIEEIMNDSSEGPAVYARIQTIGSSQVVSESFGVNQNGNLEARWQLTSTNHYCQYVLLKGSNTIVASGTTLPGETVIEFEDVDCRHNGVTQITAPIRCDAVPNIAAETMSTGESLQRRLMELSNINHEVNVRSVTPDSGSLHDHLYVRHWLVTFNIPRTGISRHVPRLSAPMPTSAQGLNHPSAAVTIVSLSDILTSDRRGINGRFVQREVGGDGMYV